MKKLYFILCMLLVVLSVHAQSPDKMTYQAIIRNSSNVLISNSVVGMQISILQGSASGTAVYVETHTPSTNMNGLVSIEIGGGTVVSGNMATIDWASGPYFIKTETDPSGGATYSITGTSQMLSVPYSFHAAMADSVINDMVDDADNDSTNELQNIEEVLLVGNDANGNNVLNTGKIGVGTSTPDMNSSIDVTTPLPVIFPRLTQTEVDAISSPVGGMVLYNSTTSKLQVFISSSAQFGNDSTTSSGTCMGSEPMWFVPTISGMITEVQLFTTNGVVETASLFVKEDFCGTPALLGTSNNQLTVTNTWVTWTFAVPVSVTAGNTYFIGSDNATNCLGVAWSAGVDDPATGSVGITCMLDSFEPAAKIMVLSGSWVDLH